LCSPVATIANDAQKFKRLIATRQSVKWVGMNYHVPDPPHPSSVSARRARHFGRRRRLRDDPAVSLWEQKRPEFGFTSGYGVAVSRTRNTSIRPPTFGSITPYHRSDLHLREASWKQGFSARSPLRTVARSPHENRGRAVSTGSRRVEAPPDGPHRRCVRGGVRRLRGRVDLGDPVQVTPTPSLTRPTK
jgi:hypothetical protein